jgi:hypothetical protein
MPRRRRVRWIQPWDTKRVITRFGVVQMPKEVDPASIQAEHLLTDHHLKIIPREELPEATRQILAKRSIEPLPVVRPKPELNAQQICMLQIIAELVSHGEGCAWDDVLYHYGVIRGLSEAMVNAHAQKVGDALVRRQLVTAEGPMLTLRGHARLRAEETAEIWRERLGLREYPLDRVERNPDPAYDEVYFIKDSRMQCYFRHECFEVRPRAKIVVLANLAPELF